MTPAALRDALVGAFGQLPIPDGHTLTAGNPRSTRDATEASRVQRALSWRHWRSFTPDDVRQWWAHGCYLNAEAWRHWLPATLDAALACPHDTRLVHAVTYALSPGYGALYWEGADTLLAQRQAVLDAAQYAAVVQFLGLMLDSPQTRHAALPALRHGWNAQPALAPSRAAQAWYAAQMHWACPAPPAEHAALVAQIEAAFADSVCPPLAALCASRQSDEPAQLCLELDGLRWQVIAPEFLDANGGCLIFMTPVGRCHFLPAYLRADVLGLLRTDGPVFKLTHEDASGLAASFAPLTTAQRQAVAAYLAFVRARDGDWNPLEAEAIDTAVAGFWGQA